MEDETDLSYEARCAVLGERCVETLSEVNYCFVTPENRYLLRHPRHPVHYTSGSGATKQVAAHALRALLEGCGCTLRIFRAVPVSTTSGDE